MADSPETLRELRGHLKRALNLLDDKAAGYIEARDYYDGTRAEVSASRALQRIIAKSSEAYPVSIGHIPVDVICDKVQVASLTATEKAAADILTIVGDANDFEDEVDDWVKKAGYFGDYYAIVDPTLEDGDGTVTVDGIKWLGSSPLTTIMIYDRRDDRTPLFGIKAWRDGEDQKALLYYDDCTVKLIAVRAGETRNVDSYDFDFDPSQGEEEADAFIFHDGGRLLLQHLAIGGKPYGVPLHKKAWGPQDAITKISSVNLSNVEGQGFAARWALLDPLREIDEDIDEDFGDDGPGTVDGDGLTTATTEARTRTVPGEIAILRGVKQVGEFSATATENFIKNQDWYIRFAAVATGIALFEFDLNGEQPSGESRRRAEGRSIQTANKVKRSVGRFLRGLGDATLAVLGTEATVAATFYPSENATDKDGLELVAAKIKTGVPVAQALLEAGYTDEQVTAWYPDGEPHMTPDLVTIYATALAALGNAKALGVISDEELTGMLPEILTARGEGAPIVEEADPLAGVVVDPGAQLKAKADALGILIRAGADPEEAAATVGLEGLSFPNLPVTVRVPESQAAGLEEK